MHRARDEGDGAEAVDHWGEWIAPSGVVLDCTAWRDGVSGKDTDASACQHVWLVSAIRFVLAHALGNHVAAVVAEADSLTLSRSTFLRSRCMLNLAVLRVILASRIACWLDVRKHGDALAANLLVPRRRWTDMHSVAHMLLRSHHVSRTSVLTSLDTVLVSTVGSGS